VTHEDVTERWRAERELENTRNFLDTVVENVPAAITVKDARKLDYVLINRGAEELFGIPRGEMIGKIAEEVFSKERTATIAKNDKYLLESGRTLRIGEHPIELKPNDRRIATTTRLPIMGDDGQPRYLLTVIQDVTEKKRDEARIERLAHYDSLTDLPQPDRLQRVLCVGARAGGDVGRELRGPVRRSRPVQGDQRHLRSLHR
jgi:PAS domain S-box-containing protein